MARKSRIQIHDCDGVQVLDMGTMEIWDGADLALLRDTLTKLFELQGCRTLGVDMTYVKYIPSGFFGMLFDFHEKGADVQLFSPRPHVQNMLWFRQFFVCVTETCFRILSEPKYPLSIGGQSGWQSPAPWSEDPVPQPAAIAASEEVGDDRWELEETEEEAPVVDPIILRYEDE